MKKKEKIRRENLIFKIKLQVTKELQYSQYFESISIWDNKLEFFKDIPSWKYFIPFIKPFNLEVDKLRITIKTNTNKKMQIEIKNDISEMGTFNELIDFIVTNYKKGESELA